MLRADQASEPLHYGATRGESNTPAETSAFVSRFFAYFQRLSRARAIKSSRLMERAMGIEPTSESWETCTPNGQNNLGTT
jgi:hypothetical protein